MTFANYADAQNWITDRSKTYGSKNKFYCSDEYRAAYPAIMAAHSNVMTATVSAGEKAMNEAGVKAGDRVARMASGFGIGEMYYGTIVMRKGIPYVKLDTGYTCAGGQKSTRWDKSWTKA